MVLGLAFLPGVGFLFKACSSFFQSFDLYIVGLSNTIILSIKLENTTFYYFNLIMAGNKSVYNYYST